MYPYGYSQGSNFVWFKIFGKTRFLVVKLKLHKLAQQSTFSIASFPFRTSLGALWTKHHVPGDPLVENKQDCD